MKSNWVDTSMGNCLEPSNGETKLITSKLKIPNAEKMIEEVSI